MLFTNSSTGAYPDETNTTDSMYYWLNSTFTYVYTDLAYINYGMYCVDSDKISGNSMYSSHSNTREYYRGVRPVVSLNSEITLTDSGTERDGCTLWNIG